MIIEIFQGFIPRVQGVPKKAQEDKGRVITIPEDITPVNRSSSQLQSGMEATGSCRTMFLTLVERNNSVTDR